MEKVVTCPSGGPAAYRLSTGQFAFIMNAISKQCKTNFFHIEMIFENEYVIESRGRSTIPVAVHLHDSRCAMTRGCKPNLA